MESRKNLRKIRDRFNDAYDALYKAVAKRNFSELDGMLESDPEAFKLRYEESTPLVLAIGDLGLFNIDGDCAADYNDIKIFFDNIKTTFQKIEKTAGKDFVDSFIFERGKIHEDPKGQRLSTRDYSFTELLTKKFVDFSDMPVKDIAEKYRKNPLVSTNEHFVEMMEKYGHKRSAGAISKGR